MQLIPKTTGEALGLFKEMFLAAAGHGDLWLASKVYLAFFGLQVCPDTRSYCVSCPVVSALSLACRPLPLPLPWPHVSCIARLL